MLRNVAVGLAVAALLGSGCGPGKDAAAGERRVAIAAASDLRFALDELATRFRQEHPRIAVDITYGSSGTFFAQLLNGAPFDLYLSADLEYPRELDRHGLAVPGSEFTYAEGRLALWVRADSPLAVAERGLNALADPTVSAIAIANPDHAPYGRAAVAALEHARLLEAVNARLVRGENISQALQFVQSGSAQAGLVALSLALAPPVRSQGRHWTVPADLHPPLEQGGIILRATRQEEAARAFRDHMLGPRGREVLDRYGFALPSE